LWLRWLICGDGTLGPHRPDYCRFRCRACGKPFNERSDGVLNRTCLSAKAVAGFMPDRMTTDGYGSHPGAIRSTLGRKVLHRTSAYLNNRLEQDHRGHEGRHPMYERLQGS
jgi:hypothetical protein